MIAKLWSLVSSVSLLGIIGASTAYSQACPVDLSGVQRSEFDHVWAAMQEIPNERGEYETTAEFAGRQAVALEGADPVHWIEMPLNHGFVEYDADTERLTVSDFATMGGGFLITPLAAGQVFGLESEFAQNTSRLVGVRARPETVEVGSYVGETGFGVRRNVRQVNQINRYIIERVDRRGSLLHRRRNARAGDVWFDVVLQPDDARNVREGGFWSVVYSPADQVWAFREGFPTRPTASNPVERTKIHRALIGDIQCILLHNSDGSVVASRATR